MSAPSTESSPVNNTTSPPAPVSNGTISPAPWNNTSFAVTPTSPVNLNQPPVPQPPPATPVSPATSPSGGMAKGTLVGLIMGIALRGVLMLMLAGIVVCIYKRGKRRRRRQYGSELYTGDPVKPKEDQLGFPPGHWQHNFTPSTDGKVTLSQKPSTPQGFAPSPQPVPVYNHAPYGNSSKSTSLAYDRSATPAGLSLGLSQSTFTYEELAMATDGFSSYNLLGQGGFGLVHKGILSNGKEVAIKQLKSGSGQGEREFQAEVEVISRVHHRHLVSLVGYCISGERRLLVYEFVPNNNLEFHLHGHDRPPMDWPTRMKIALGSARGLAYLHEDCQPKIIHRDIKAANILLDYSFEAKVADFGLAKISLDTDTHISTRVMGTFGYLAPEYAATGKLTEKSDVFSFGVVLLELITGHRPIDRSQSFTDDSMVDWARPLLSQALDTGNFDALVDQKLEKNYNSDEMLGMIACAATCVRHSARRRPQMSQVVRALEGNISPDDLNKGTAPGHSTAFSSFDSSNYETSQYNEDLKRFRKLVIRNSGSRY